RSALVACIGAAGLVMGVGPSAAQAAPSAPVANVVNSCASARAGFAACMSVRRTDLVNSFHMVRSASPNATPNALPSGFGPADLQSAYKLAANGGAGQTVAIVDAFDNPNIATDLATYRSTFGLPAANFRKVNQNGQASPLPSTDTGWGEEESL